MTAISIQCRQNITKKRIEHSWWTSSHNIGTQVIKKGSSDTKRPTARDERRWQLFLAEYQL